MAQYQAVQLRVKREGLLFQEEQVLQVVRIRLS